MNPVRPLNLLSRSRSRIVWGRTLRFAAAGALLWGLSGCTLPEDDPGVPVDPGDPAVPQGRQVRTSFRVSVSEFYEPLGVFMVLDETPNVAGLFAGTLTLSRYGEAESVEVAAVLDGEDELHVGAGELGVGYEWDELRIALRDGDGDGVYESGSGFMSGVRDWFSGGEPFTGEFEAAPDAYRVAASVRPEGHFDGALLPWQPLVIDFGQPVPNDDASLFVVLADGEEVYGDARVEVFQPSQTSIRFVPRAFYPPGSELRVVLVDMKNALGVQVEAEDEALPVIADAGPINANLGFEQGLTGWNALGAAGTADRYGDVVPAEGAAMAVIQSPGGDDGDEGLSRLVGYLDVPEGASELDVSLAVLTEDQLPAAVTVRLYREDSLTEPRVFRIYEFEHEAERFEPCDCADVFLTRRAGAFRRQLGLAEFRGERVYLEFLLDGEPWFEAVAPADVEGFGVLPIPPPPPPVNAALIIDDIQIR
jgi:hypothetical protein